MRTLLSLAIALLFAANVFADEDKRGKNEKPIKEIKLERKTPVLYDKDIEPILVNKCAYCHSGNVKESKLDLSSYDNLIKGGKRGKPFVAGNPGASLLVKLSAKAVRPFMPPKSDDPLTPEELALIKLWIDQGAKAPTGMRTAPKVILKTPPAGVTPVLGVAVSADKSAVASSRGNQIHIYDASSGTHVRTLIDSGLVGQDKKPVKAAHLSLVESLAFSPDGKYLASGSFREIVLWDARTGVLKKRFTGLTDRVVALGFSHDSKMLAAGGGAPTQDGELKVFDLGTGKVVADLKTAHSDTVFGVCFSPDDKMLASGSADKFVKVHEVAGWKLAKSFEGHSDHVLAVGWKGDGKLLASAGADNVVKVWDYAKGEQVRTINAHGKQITSLQFIGKSSLFVTCSGDKQVRVWNVDNGGNTRNFGAGSDFLYAAAVSADGTVVAAGGQEGITQLFNGTSGALIKAMLPPGAEKPTDPKKKK
jgi:WD40 repeat protein